MKEFIIVGAGGFLGAVARFQLGQWLLRQAEGLKFPLHTFAVNVVGCFVAGLLAGIFEANESFSTTWRLFLFAGVLGGFTTFSAFGLETFMLFRRDAAPVALANVVLSVTACMLMLWCGFRLAAHFFK